MGEPALLALRMMLLIGKSVCAPIRWGDGGDVGRATSSD